MRPWLLVLVAALTMTTKAEAVSLMNATACGRAILESYEQKRFPRELVDVNAIITRAVGADMRRLSREQKSLVFSVAQHLLKESFEQPDTEYEIRDLDVTYVERTRRGYRATGTVFIRSTDYTGTVNFMALNSGLGCTVYQVRIADWTSLDASLRAKLRRHPRTRGLIGR